MHEGLSFAAFPVCVQSHGAGGEIRTPNLLGLSQPPLPFWPHPHVSQFVKDLPLSRQCAAIGQNKTRSL